MPHTYTARALPTACNVYRDGEPFALLTPRNMTKEAYLSVMRFTEALPGVIDALRESMDTMERMDRALIAMQGDDPTTYPPKGEVIRARAALQAIGAI